MKIRYYLRGLGLGILFTSIFFMVSNSGVSKTMSDAEIKARAKELGMTESTVLADITGESEAESIEELSVEETMPVESIVETVVEEPVTEEAVTEENTVEESVTEINAEADQEESPEESSEGGETEPVSEEESSQSISSNTEPVSVIVNRGEGSDTVSHRLQEAGLVADAYEYDRYLMANGYDKKIGAGEHIIPAGATWEEIADILCH